MKILLSAFLALCLSLALSGCQTAPGFTAPASGWRTHTGQLRYVSTTNPVIGEVIVRTGTGSSDFQSEFLSGPGFPLLRIRSNATRGFAEGALARGRWQGELTKAPATLTGWFLLPQVFDAVDSKTGSLSGNNWRATATRTGSKLTRLDVHIASTGERFTFHFGS